MGCQRTRTVCDDLLRIIPVVCGWAQEQTTKGMVETSDGLRFGQDRGLILVPAQYGFLDVVDVHTAHTGTANLKLKMVAGQVIEEQKQDDIPHEQPQSYP